MKLVAYFQNLIQLNVIINSQKYLNPLKLPENSGIIDSQIVDEIFFMVPSIANIHERFLDELKRRLDAWDPLQKVGDAFVEVVCTFKIIFNHNKSDYCLSYIIFSSRSHRF